MAKYRVLEKSFIGNRLVDEGAEIEFDGEAGDNLELIDPLDHDGDGKKGGARKAPAAE